MPSTRTPAHDLRVVPHRPERERMLAAAAVVAVLVVGSAGWWLGGSRVSSQRDAALIELDALAEDVRRLEQENARLSRELGDERLARAAGGAFSDQVRDTLAEQAATIARLEEQNRFYGNLMAGGEDGELQIADLELLERLDGGGVRFRLLLVQPADRRADIAGHVEVRVVGARNGERAVLAGAELGDGLQAPLPFRFRYFQRLAGELELPDGFEPQGVEIVATSETDDGFNLQRTFSWELQEA